MTSTDTASDKPDFNGKYEHVRSENLEAFLAENGAPWMIRKMATKTSPNYLVKQEGDKFEMKMVSLMMTKEFNFTIGQDYEEAQHNNKLYKISPSWDGGKVVLVMEPKDPDSGLKSQKHTRELNGDEFILTMEVGDVTCRRYFKKVEA